MSKKLKLGIVGMGAIGTVHAKAHQAVGEAEITAVCDVNQSALDKAATTFDVPNAYIDYADLLRSDVDAVAVCVGNALHKEVAIAAAEAGKHVFLEKPMAMNAIESAEIAQAVEKAGVTLQMGMAWRFNPAAKVIREWVESGRLGEIYHIRAVLIRRRGIPGLGGWFTTKAASGGGPLIDVGVHWFDLSMHLTGLWSPTAVSANTYAQFGPRMADYTHVSMWAGPPKLEGVFDVEDYACGTVRFGRKATMNFDIAWAANATQESYIDIIGSDGGVRFGDKSVRIITEHAGRLADIEPHFDTNGNSYEGEARAFLAACRGEAPSAATAAEGVTVMKLIDAVYASAEAGREIAIDA